MNIFKRCKLFKRVSLFSFKDPFVEFDERDAAKRRARFQRAIKIAKRNGYCSYEFIKSCQEFLNRTGILTEKQIAALRATYPEYAYDDDYWWDNCES